MLGQAPDFHVPQASSNILQSLLDAMAQRLEYPAELQMQAAEDQTAMAHDVGRAVGEWWNDPAVQAWQAPFTENPSRLIGALIAGQNPLAGDRSSAVLDAPLTSEALIERGVPEWLASLSEMFVPDPTGARRVGDLFPLLAMLPGIPLGLQRLWMRYFPGTPQDLMGKPATIFHGVGTGDRVIDVPLLANYEGHGHSGFFGAVDPSYSSEYTGRYASGYSDGPGNVQGFGVGFRNPSVVPSAVANPLPLTDFMASPAYAQAAPHLTVGGHPLSEVLSDPALYEQLTSYKLPDNAATAMRNLSAGMSPNPVVDTRTGERVPLTELHKMFGFDSHVAIREWPANSEVAAYSLDQIVPLNQETTLGLEQMVRSLRAAGASDHEIRAALATRPATVQEAAAEQIALLESLDVHDGNPLAPWGGAQVMDTPYDDMNLTNYEADLRTMEDYMRRALAPSQHDPEVWGSPHTFQERGPLSPAEIDDIMQRASGPPPSPTLPATPIDLLAGPRAQSDAVRQALRRVERMADAEPAAIRRELTEQLQSEGFLPYGMTDEANAAIDEATDYILELVANNPHSFPFSLNANIPASSFARFDDLDLWGKDAADAFGFTAYNSMDAGTAAGLIGGHFASTPGRVGAALYRLYPDASDADINRLLAHVLEKGVQAGWVGPAAAENLIQVYRLPGQRPMAGVAASQRQALPDLPKPVRRSDLSDFSDPHAWVEDFRDYATRHHGRTYKYALDLQPGTFDQVHSEVARIYPDATPEQLFTFYDQLLTGSAGGWSRSDFLATRDHVAQRLGITPPPLQRIVLTNRPYFLEPDSPAKLTRNNSLEEMAEELERWGYESVDFLDALRANPEGVRDAIYGTYPELSKSDVLDAIDEVLIRAEDAGRIAPGDAAASRYRLGFGPRPRWDQSSVPPVLPSSDADEAIDAFMKIYLGEDQLFYRLLNPLSVYQDLSKLYPGLDALDLQRFLSAAVTRGARDGHYDPGQAAVLMRRVSELGGP